MNKTEISSPIPSHAPVEELDRRYVFHPFTQLELHASSDAPVIVEGEGVRLRDSQGRTYLDGMAGLWCVNVGYGRPEIADALQREATRLGYFHAFGSMATDLPAYLAERVLSVCPVPMSKVFFGNSGSDANDTQVKLVWYYNNALGRPKKKKIIALRPGYHGSSVMTASLTGMAGLHEGFDLPLPMIRHAEAPHRLWVAEPGESDEAFAQRLADDLEALILVEGPETVAALIAEPVQGAGGVIVPPATYFAQIQRVLRRHDVLLIADEVVTGFGRLGRWFGCEVFGIEPDLITVAKGITSGYVPLSACLVSERVWSVLVEGSAALGGFGHGYTYSAHPLAAAAALANLDILERDMLIEQAAERGDHMQKRLSDAFVDHPLVGEVRGHGLIGAVEFVAAKDPPQKFDPTRQIGFRIAQRCLELGLIIRALPVGDVFGFAPPFVVSEAELDEMVTIARRAVDGVALELQKES